MQDEFDRASARTSQRTGFSGRALALSLVAALGVGGVVGLAAASRLDVGDRPRPAAANPVPARMNPVPAPVGTGVENAQQNLDARMAELEQRLSRLSGQAEAASGNATRAESLLIAAAARRAVERGAPLGYLADQLRLRFGAAQPNAVETLVEVSANPVTLPDLQQELGEFEAALRTPAANADGFARLRQELSSLFVIRRVGAREPAPAQRLERARAFLAGGRVDAAMAEVQSATRNPLAGEWLGRAQRYVRAQRALDLIETAALLEPKAVQAPAAVSPFAT